MIKNTFTLIFLIAMATASVFGQVDTTFKFKKTGFSMFGGCGLGGNDLSSGNHNINSGYAKAVSARFHYGTHTINAYAANVTAYEQAQSNYSRYLAFDAYNFGLTYGIGTYGKHFSAGCLVGVGYSSFKTTFANMQVLNTNLDGDQKYLTEQRDALNACFGLHASTRIKYIGIGYQVYYNLFGGFSSFTALLGLEVTLK